MIPQDPAIRKLLIDLADLQAYPMPRYRAESSEIAEQRKQLHDRALVFLDHVMTWARALNEVAPITDKVTRDQIAEFSDSYRDAFDALLARFKGAEETLEEEERAA